MATWAPGNHYRKGMTLAELFCEFPNDASAEAWFLATRWPNGPQCPHCRSDRIQTGAAHPTMPMRCRDCRKRFSVRTGTVMADSKLGLQTWALATYLLTTGIKGTSSMKLHRDLGITQKSAWHLAHRIRETWQNTPEPFTGPVEADKSYFGGREPNKHAHVCQPKAIGGVGKDIVAGVKDRETNRISAKVVTGTHGRILRSFVRKRVQDGAAIYTDTHGGYTGLPNRTALNHNVGEYVNGQAHVNGMESLRVVSTRPIRLRRSPTGVSVMSRLPRNPGPTAKTRQPAHPRASRPRGRSFRLWLR